MSILEAAPPRSIARAPAKVLRKALPFAYPTADAPLVLFEEPLFHDARIAVRFAFTGEGAPKRPASSRMLDKSAFRGRGINGTDAAAQAGMIKSVLRRLGDLAVSCLVASSCPSTTPCQCQRPCCAGKLVCAPWHEAISKLASAAERIQAPDGGHPLSRSTYPARVAVLIKFYARKLTLQQIAEQVAVDEETIGRYHRAVVRWLNGSRAGKNGEPAIEGFDQIAWREAESLLRNTGIVGA